MELNYERRYAYAEVYEIINWLGEEYINKLPKKILRLIKDEKKFGYKPEIDFSKSLTNQVRQETKDLIAYFEYKYWLEDEKQKQDLKETLKKNNIKKKERERAERQNRQAIINQNVKSGLNAQLDNALKNLK